MSMTWSVEHGFNGIQGSTMVTCLGTAFASVYQWTDDGRQYSLKTEHWEEGTRYESMNMAATWKFPIIYCLVNNGYAISTLHEGSPSPEGELKTWGEGYEVPSLRLDGNDIEAVIEAVEKGRGPRQKGRGPTVLEFMTYRW